MVYNLLPTLCLLCRCFSENGQICHDCEQALPALGQACVHCALPISAGTQCGRCLRKAPLIAKSTSPLRYESWTKGLISRFKFNRDLSVGHYLSRCLARSIEHHYRDDHLPLAIIPVPLHAQRLYERGFNQSVELAKPLAKQFSIPLMRHAVERHGAHVDQIGLSALARRRNVRGVFQVVDALPAHIVIIDDVVTTGATVLELAKQAHKNGATRIDVWCVARTVTR